MSAIPKPDLAASASAFVVPAGDARPGGVLTPFGLQTLIKISSRDTNGAFAVAETLVPPLVGPPLHLHHVQDEWCYILEGEFLFEVDGTLIHAGAGDTVFAPKGSRHTFQNIGELPGRSIVTVVPGGLDLFFEEVCQVTRTGDSPDPVVLLPLFTKYGLELLGSPLSARK